MVLNRTTDHKVKQHSINKYYHQSSGSLIWKIIKKLPWI